MEEVIEVLNLLEPALEGFDRGTLTDDERDAIEIAEGLLDVVHLPGVGKLFNMIPIEQIAELLVTWRKVIATVDEGTITIGKLGDGVEIGPLG